MKTKDLLLYGAIGYIVYLQFFKKSLSVTKTIITPISPLDNSCNCQNCTPTTASTDSLHHFILNTPQTTGVPQIEPTPASVLSPEQLQNFDNSIGMGKVKRFPFTI
jgi:hypothetical protein